MIDQFNLPVDIDDNDKILAACEGLNTALQHLIPLARKLHLLSFNGACSAARAGSNGDVFRILTQDIQYLSDEVTVCIEETQFKMKNIMMLASRVVSILPSPSLLDQRCTTMDKTTFIHFSDQENDQLAPLFHQLSLTFFQLSTAVRKGEYLAVFALVEAANSDEPHLSFEIVASTLKSIIADLKLQSKIQKNLLDDLVEFVIQ